VCAGRRSRLSGRFRPAVVAVAVRGGAGGSCSGQAAACQAVNPEWLESQWELLSVQPWFRGEESYRRDDATRELATKPTGTGRGEAEWRGGNRHHGRGPRSRRSLPPIRDLCGAHLLLRAGALCHQLQDAGQQNRLHAHFADLGKGEAAGTHAHAYRGRTALFHGLAGAPCLPQRASSVGGPQIECAGTNAVPPRLAVAAALQHCSQVDQVLHW
jgi:hypothetical protein